MASLEVVRGYELAAASAFPPAVRVGCGGGPAGAERLLAAELPVQLHCD